MNNLINSLQTEAIVFKPIIDPSKIIELPELHYIFQISKKVTFDINFYRLGSNEHQNFNTSANEFNQPKTDYCRCGQCQDEVLTGLSKQFYKKWDILHGHPLTQGIYNELLVDIEELKTRYNFIFQETGSISFEKDKALSKLTPKKH